MISWLSRKQSNVSLSTAEAEYIAACFDICEAIWLRKLMLGLFNLELDTTVILCDNQSCIKMTENPVFHDRSKHIEIRYFYIRDKIQMMMFQYFYTEDIDDDAFSIHILEIQMMIVQYSHTEDVDDDGSDDDVTR